MLTPTLMKIGLRLQQSDSDEVSGENLNEHQSVKHHAVVVGAGPIGRSIASQLETFGNEVCIVDLSPINLHSFAQQGFQTVAGNATEASVLERSGVGGGESVVVCVPDDGTANRIVKAVRHLNRDCRIVVRCRYQSNIKKLKKAGATDIVAEENEAALALMRSLERPTRDAERGQGLANE